MSTNCDGRQRRRRGVRLRPYPPRRSAMNIRLIPILRMALLSACGLALPVQGQGPLPPPGPGSLPFADRALDATGTPVPSMKSLTQTDPGQPIPSRDANLPALTGSAGNYTISRPGHYYLTENLTKQVVIDADDVTLDLRGYLIEFVHHGAERAYQRGLADWGAARQDVPGAWAAGIGCEHVRDSVRAVGIGGVVHGAGTEA